jgi:hypothetical protein
MGKVGGTAVICAGVSYIFSVELFRGFYLQIVLPEEIYIISEGSIPLKVPKREIFVTELIILSHPIWIGDLRTKAKNRFVRIVRLLFAILVFFR